jgi:heme/copper-type cytochrome/quinol oxidase subunit 4
MNTPFAVTQDSASSINLSATGIAVVALIVTSLLMWFIHARDNADRVHTVVVILFVIVVPATLVVIGGTGWGPFAWLSHILNKPPIVGK